MLPPDEIDTFTEVYQYRKYLDEHQKEFKSKYEKMQADKKALDAFKQRYGIVDDD